MKVARLIGAAGSGKTTELIRIMERALPSLGGNPMSLGFASFTRAARQEAASRAASAWNVEEKSLTSHGWFRTVHAVCYRQLGIASDQMLTDRKADIEWLADAFGVRLSTTIDDDAGSSIYIGDPVVAASLNIWQLHRATLHPLDSLITKIKRIDDSIPSSSEVRRIAERYETAKRLDGRCDYTDLLCRYAGISISPRHGIGTCNPEGDLPPVQAWLFDEQQDASPLLDAVCKRLVSSPLVKWCYVVGDPFQAIYGWAGSSADCFLGWPASKERIMPKSYRCPAPILRLGEECLRKMRRGYFDRNVAPADHEGTITRHGDVEEMTSLMQDDREWLFLARTNFQASRLWGYLNAIGIPARSTKAPQDINIKQIGLAALYALENGDAISGEQWARAVPLICSQTADKVKMLERGAKKRWKDEEQVKKWDYVWQDDLEQLGATPALVGKIKSGDWCSLVDGGTSWRKIAKKWGVDRAMNPRVRVGTIHSAKGMEADNVAVLTTTSRRIQDGAEDDDRHDEECRLAYVAATRARHNLHIINEAGMGRPRMEELA